MALIARLAIFLEICVELLISHLRFVRIVRNLISNHDLIEMMEFYAEKMKKEKLGHFEKHVYFR